MKDKKERWVKVILKDQEEGSPKIGIKAKGVHRVEILGMLSIATNYYGNRFDDKVKSHRIKVLEKELEEIRNEQLNK